MEKFLYLHLEHADEDMPNGILPIYLLINTGLIHNVVRGPLKNGECMVGILSEENKIEFPTGQILECKTNDQYVERFLKNMGIEVVLEHG